MEKRNDPWYKKIIIFIGICFSVIITFIFGRKRVQGIRRRDNNIRDNLGESTRINNETKDRVEQLETNVIELERSIETIEGSTRDVETNTRQCLDIIHDIRERNK